VTAPGAGVQSDVYVAAELDEGHAAALEELERFLPAPVDHDIVLSTDDVAVTFGGVKALVGVSIEVPAREFVGLIGPNGAGKSTLFDVVNGFTAPTSGRVFAFGRDVTRMSPWDRAKLGMSRTFQANHIDPHATVADNLLAGAHQLIRGGVVSGILRTRSNAADEFRARRMAAAVARVLDLSPVAGARAGSLEFAAQRRVEIGRSLMSGPRLLLLDEPTAGIDIHDASLLMGVVKRLQVELGLTVLLVEHFVRAVLENADRVFALDQGRIIASGTPDVIAADPAVKAAYLGG
jgi:ABC-type branched-subunit amino acid transport system ATPase component